MTERLKLAILVSGEGTTLDAVAEACSSGRLPAEIVLVASDRPQCGAVLKAVKRNLPVILVRPTEGWEGLLARHLQASGAELVILAGYLKILKGEVLDSFPGRIINSHPALLPKFGGPGMYGIKVHQAVISSGEKVTGSTVHLVTKDVDSGPIISQRKLDVNLGETAETLSARQRPMEHELVIETIGKFASGELKLPWSTGPITYASAGVDMDRVRSALAAFVNELRFSPPPERGKVLSGPGLFSGVVEVNGTRLAMTTDNVGTKVLLAQELGRWEEVGQDMVAINVNDLTAAGARPVALVDYIMCRKPDSKVLAALGRGVNKGTALSGCSVLGGETCIVPEILKADYDLSATAIGTYPTGWKVMTGSELKPGDVLIGLPSSGFHSNGYTLVRRLLRDRRLSLESKVPGLDRTLGDALLAPTETYAPQVERLLSKGLPTALSHITGGAFQKNLMRLNKDVRFVLDRIPKPGGIFAWVEKLSELSPEELYKTFNMGIGFVVAVRERDHSDSLGLLNHGNGPRATVIGQVESGSGVVIPQLGVSYSSW